MYAGELTRSVSHTSDDIETCTTWEIAMQDFFNLFHCGLSWHSQRPKKWTTPLDRYFTCALVDVMEVHTTCVPDQTYQQIRESFRDPMLRFLMFHG